MAYQPKSASALLNAGAPKELVFSSQVFVQGDTWFRILPLDPAYATNDCIFPVFTYLHNGKRRLVSYATWQQDCIIQAFLRVALSTGDVGIQRIVTEFINEKKFHELKSPTQEAGSTKELLVSMLGLTLNPRLDKTSPDTFSVTEEFQGNPNPFICSIKQKTVQDEILNIGASRKALTFLKPKEGNAVCVNRTGQGAMGTKYKVTLSEDPVPLDECYFTPQSQSNPKGYPDLIRVTLNQTQSPECVLNYMLNAFLGEAHPIDKALETQEFDPLADDAKDRIAEVIASIKPSLFQVSPSFAVSGVGGIADRLGSND